MWCVSSVPKGDTWNIVERKKPSILKTPPTEAGSMPIRPKAGPVSAENLPENLPENLSESAPGPPSPEPVIAELSLAADPDKDKENLLSEEEADKLLLKQQIQTPQQAAERSKHASPALPPACDL